MPLYKLNTSTLPPAPQAMGAETFDQASPQTEDFFVSAGELYMPVNGEFRPDKSEPLAHGTMVIGTYITERAMHPTRIYLPEGYKPADNNPIVARTSALGTGVKGLNHKFSQEILDTGSVVISKGPPRYYGPRLHSLTQTEDANELHGLVNAAEKQGIIGSAEEVYVDGQSQSAMKGLGFIAVAIFYGREVVDGHIVAPCFLDKANVRNPRKFIRYGTSMVASVIRAGQNLSLEELLELRGTLAIRDGHHHVIVVPNLLSGETGQFLPLIAPDQRASVDLYGKDRSSRAHRAFMKFTTLFPNMDVSLDEEYGHCDGIMSPETKARREEVFSRAAQDRDASPVLKVLS